MTEEQTKFVQKVLEDYVAEAVGLIGELSYDISESKKKLKEEIEETIQEAASLGIVLTAPKV